MTGRGEVAGSWRKGTVSEKVREGERFLRDSTKQRGNDREVGWNEGGRNKVETHSQKVISEW